VFSGQFRTSNAERQRTRRLRTQDLMLHVPVRHGLSPRKEERIREKEKDVTMNNLTEPVHLGASTIRIN